MMHQTNNSFCIPNFLAYNKLDKTSCLPAQAVESWLLLNADNLLI